MRQTPRIFPSDLDAGERRVYGGLTLFFCLVFLALSWPVYALFSDIRPLILGMPLSLAYIVGVLILSFLVLVALYRWEDRRGTLDAGSGGAAEDRDGAGSGGRAGVRSRAGEPADGGGGGAPRGEG